MRIDPISLLTQLGRNRPALGLVYTLGDATSPTKDSSDDMRFIVHCCNNIGAWGAGFVLALSKRWPETETAYHSWYDGIPTVYGETGPLQLGEVQFIRVEPDIVVCNLIGQHGTIGGEPPFGTNEPTDGVPVRYEAIELGLAKVRQTMLSYDVDKRPCTFHAPRMGAGLAGGDWKYIERSIQRTMCNTGVPAVVYDFPEPKKVTVIPKAEPPAEVPTAS